MFMSLEAVGWGGRSCRVTWQAQTFSTSINVSSLAIPFPRPPKWMSLFLAGAKHLLQLETPHRDLLNSDLSAARLEGGVACPPDRRGLEREG